MHTYETGFNTLTRHRRGKKNAGLKSTYQLTYGSTYETFASIFKRTSYC